MFLIAMGAATIDSHPNPQTGCALCQLWHYSTPELPHLLIWMELALSSWWICQDHRSQSLLILELFFGTRAPPWSDQTVG